jgi:glycosyltransferase involved in cell wall biosynthesis
MKTVLIIPVYNEELRFNETYFDSIIRNENVGLIFVNDGSKDRTRVILGEYQSKNTSRVKLINLDKNQGKATAIRLGMLEAKTQNWEWIGFLDADGAFPVEVVEKALIGLTQTSGEIQSLWFSRVKLAGSRIERNWIRHFLGRVIVTLITSGLSNCPYDTQAGFKVFRRNLSMSELWEAPFRTRWLFDVEIFLRLKELHLSNYIKEIPVEAWEDKAGSKLGYKTFFRIIIEMTSIWKLRLKN